MRWKSLCGSKLAALGMGAIFLGGTVAAAPLSAASHDPVAASVNWDFQEEASGLVGEVKSLAHSLHREADTLASLSRSNQVSSQTHARYLNTVRDHVNDIGERLERLQTINHTLASWQQLAGEKLSSVAAELAGRTEAAIVHLNNNQQHLFAESYRENVGQIAALSSDLKDTASKFADYGQTQQRFERLQRQLEIPSL